jgi:hypothetical protein
VFERVRSNIGASSNATAAAKLRLLCNIAIHTKKEIFDLTCCAEAGSIYRAGTKKLAGSKAQAYQTLRVNMPA